ncbi:MAG: DUF1801 domain-containing protein [Bacteroidota bacterium]|nr:DUF1801 domain-containing protein [Bacteroidota bacterium]
MVKGTFKNTDEYISFFPDYIQTKLQEIKSIIKKAAPNSEEIISYNMPAYKLKAVLVYFAGYKNHIGFYPTASGIKNFEPEFGNYKYSKGAVQFPLNQALPIELITKIVKFRIEEVSKLN